MKPKLKAVLVTLAIAVTSEASAQTLLSLDRPNLSGAWKCEGKCQIPGGGTKIEQTAASASVTCTNEVGQISVGVMLTIRTVSCWGLAGQISEDNKAINWGNQTQWVR
jgi:hypothetical protein